MTRERDIERVLDAWFEPGPTEMPDRLFDDVLARVDRLPQRRALPTLRFLPMNSRIRWLALAAAALVVAVAGLALINRPRNDDVGASPTPSASSSPTTVPAELIGVWMGGPRDLPGLLEQAGTTLSFTAREVSITASNQIDMSFLRSAAAEAGDHRLALGLTPMGCEADAVGTYTWSLSTGGRILTIDGSSKVDPCARRAAVLPGTWWKMDCPTKDDSCLGDLEPGSYSSQFFDPFIAPGSDWLPRFGALEYTVPDGWSNTFDWPTDILFKPVGADTAEIILYADPVPHAQGAGQCTETAEPGVGRDAVSFAEFLANSPGLMPTTADPISIGGLDGRTVDLEVDASWTATCPYSNGTPMVSTVTDIDTEPGLDWNIPAGSKARYILLDLGEGRALLIKVEAGTKAEFDAYIDEAMTVIQSFQFNR